MTKEELLNKYPEVLLLESHSASEVEHYLHQRGWITEDETIITLSKAGEGNMNCTLRAQSNQRSLILKQSLPWVAKYPTIEAPWDRIIREVRFFQTIQPVQTLSDAMPAFIDLDITSRIALFEDLGDNAQNCSILYEDTSLNEAALKTMTDWLSTLHNTEFDSENRSALTNRDMRALNHEHIFNFPLVIENGFDLEPITPGLQAIANELKNDSAYVRTVRELGEAYYLTDGPTLLHGDYFPGSWLVNETGLKVIDPEFAFFGHAEFDVGIVIAHMKLAQQPQAALDFFLNNYQHPAKFDQDIAYQLAGVEIMRRLIGVAQLPISYGLDTKTALLHLSKEWVVGRDCNRI